ncbi:EAL domain-containing protein [Marinomonas algicola]|uniref:EAL domain-containing protein n=1 Tax=Marinomonas algicola TaxID=2773454 RepID=UPI00174BAD9C|nr:EAL domain-containing protein [Marinomonas algicola]
MFNSNHRALPSILLIDDVPSNLQVLYDAVEGFGDIYFATDGQSAIKKAIECIPDVILLDIELPDMNGYEVLHQLRQIPELQESSVIFVTGHSDNVHELRALESGGVDFIQKPIDISITRARVETQLTLKKQKDKIAKSAEDLSLLVNALPAFIAYWDKDDKNVFCNDIEGRWFGISASEMLDLGLTDVMPDNVHDDIQANINRAFQGEKINIDVSLSSIQSSSTFGQLSIIPRSGMDRDLGFLMLITDITSRKMAEQALHDEKERIRVTLNSIGDAVIATDINGFVTFLNPIAESMTGYSLEHARGKEIETIMPLIDLESGMTLKNPIRIALEEERIVGMALNCVLQHSQGIGVEVEDSAAPIRDHKGDITGAIIVFHDVSEARAMAIKMTHLAQHDALTNLPNRLLLSDRAQQAIKQVEGSTKKAALMIFDIDNFKSINELLGHEGGDRLLQQIANHLQTILKPDETLFRQGGNTFILLLSNLDSTIQIMRCISKLQKAFNNNWRVKENDFTLTISAGISIYSEDSFNIDELYRHADTALFTAKQSGKNKILFYSQEFEKKLLLEQELEKSLKNPSSDSHFEVFYQPKLNVYTNKIVGAEALVRWRNAKGDLVFPNDFIPLAEETGLIIPLGEKVLFQACKQAALWYQEGFKIQIAVNVSLVQFEDQDFLSTVKHVLHETKLKPELLELELTESVLAKDVGHARSLISNIKKLGVAIALDDFGTGYSSLSYLKDFKIDVLKIDQSFIRDMFKSASNKVIIAAIIQMAKGLQLKLIAEGVETKEHSEQLAEMGCEIMQGYLYSKPIPVQDFNALLALKNNEEIAPLSV